MRGSTISSVFAVVVVSLVVFLSTLLGAGPNGVAAPAAASATVAVTSVATHGMDVAAAPRFAKSLLGGLASGGLNVVGLGKVRTSLKAHKGLQGCETAVCLKRIGALLGVAFTGRTSVELSGSTTFRVEVVLTDVRTGKPVARVEKRCDLCTLKEANETLSQAAMEAAGMLAGTPGPGRNAPRKLRRLPPRGASHAGSGATAPRSTGTLKDPQIRTVDRGRSLRRWGIAAIGAGVAAIAPGIALLVIHGRDTGEGPPSSDRYRWNTRVGGAVLTAAGAALGVTGVTLVVVGLLRRKVRLPAISVAWSRRGRSVTVKGAFRF